MASSFSSSGRFYLVNTRAIIGCAILFCTRPLFSMLLYWSSSWGCLRTNPGTGHEKSQLLYRHCSTLSNLLGKLRADFAFLALISGTKVNWDNSEFTPISLRLWFKNTCNVRFKIISFDWKYFEMFLSTGFKRCHFFMNAEMLINKIPKALTQLSGLQLFPLFIVMICENKCNKKKSQQLC